MAPPDLLLHDANIPKQRNRAISLNREGRIVIEDKAQRSVRLRFGQLSDDEFAFRLYVDRDGGTRTAHKGGLATRDE